MCISVCNRHQGEEHYDFTCGVEMQATNPDDACNFTSRLRDIAINEADNA